MNKDQIKGRVKEADGKAKEIIGDAVGSKKMEKKGKSKKNAGKLQKGFGDIKDDLKNGV